METTINMEDVYISLPDSDFSFLKTLSKRMGWTIKKVKKTGLEAALDDVKEGRVYKAHSVDELFRQLEG